MIEKAVPSSRLGRGDHTNVGDTIVSHTIRITTLLLTWLAYAAQAQDVEAYIVIDVSGRNVQSLTFTNLESNESISVPKGGKMRHSFQPGAYYLRRVETSFIGDYTRAYPVPEEPLFAVEPGSVLYLGDWKFGESWPSIDTEWKLAVEYSQKTIRELIEDPTICERLSCLVHMPDRSIRRLELQE